MNDTERAREALECFAAEAYPKIARAIWRITRNSEHVNDLVQETFLRAFASVHTADPNRSLAPWVYTIARNVALDSVRRSKARLQLPIENDVAATEDEDVADGIVREAEANRLREAVAHLRPQYRDAIDLYYFRDLRYVDIANELDMPIGTVKTFIARAKRDLRARLADSSQAAA